MLPHQIVIELTSASGGFVLQNTLHWIKSIAIDTATEKTKPSDPHLSSFPGRGESDAKRQLRIEATVKTLGHFKPIIISQDTSARESERWVKIYRDLFQ